MRQRAVVAGRLLRQQFRLREREFYGDELPRVFHVVRAIRGRHVRGESDVWPRGTVARRRLGKARRLRESC